MFAERLQNLMDENKMSKYKLAKLVGCSQSTVGYWLDGKTVPQNRTMQAVADVFSVPTSFLRGETDTYGLSPTDWEWMGQAFSAERKLRGKSIADVSDDYTVSIDDIRKFEEDGTPLSINQLEIICALAGTNTLNVFAAWKNKLYPSAKADEIADSLQALRDEQRVLLQASNHLSRSQILAMAEFMKTVKGENDID